MRYDFPNRQRIFGEHRSKDSFHSESRRFRIGIIVVVDVVREGGNLMEKIDEEKMKQATLLLAECNDAECFRVMSYLQMRLEYLHGVEMMRLANVHPN